MAELGREVAKLRGALILAGRSRELWKQRAIAAGWRSPRGYAESTDVPPVEAPSAGPDIPIPLCPKCGDPVITSGCYPGDGVCGGSAS